MKLVLIVALLAVVTGCQGRLTGYNLKATVGNTSYEDGRNAFFTGGSVDAHFDVNH